jgi:hypothetical protein
MLAAACLIIKDELRNRHLTRIAAQKGYSSSQSNLQTNEQYTFEVYEGSAYPIPRALGRRDQDHLCTIGQTNVQRVDHIKNEPVNVNDKHYTRLTGTC